MWTNKPPLNLQKQVLKNQEDIETLQTTHFVEGGFNMTAAIKYKEASLTALQAHTAADESLGTFGMVGDVLYVVAKTGDAEQTWKELGVFPAVGPQGPQGAKGDTGLPALVFNDSILVSTVPSVGQTFSYGPTMSFNRTPAVGDNFIALIGYKSIEDDYLCQCRITAVNSPSFTATYVNVTKATGKDGRSFSDYTSISVLTDKGLTYDKDVYGARFSSQVTLFDGSNNAIQTGDIYLPIKGGNGITVGAASDNKFLEVKVGDTINLAENQSVTIGDEVQIKNEDGKTILNLDVNATDSFQFEISGETAPYHQHINGDSIITDQAPGAMWSYANGYYEITGVPTSSTSGTLPNDNGLTYLTTYPQKLRLLFNKEFYQLADNQHTTGKLVYSHVTYEDNKTLIKTITITIATRGWVLTEKSIPTNLAIGTSDITDDSDRQHVIGKLIYNLPMYANQNAEVFVETISNLQYLMCTGYVTYNNVTEPVIGADSYASSNGSILIYTPTHNLDAGGIMAFVTGFDPDYINYNN